MSKKELGYHNQQQDKLNQQLKQKFMNSIQDLQQLEKHHQLPPKMHLKLHYLILKINKQPINQQQFSALPQYELQSLEQIDRQTQIKLFCNIVDCMSGKETIVYFRDEKTYIRKDSFFTRWSACYISCDSSKITVQKHKKQQPYYKFELKFMRISRACEYFKSKHVFGIIYKDKKFLFGFNNQSGCQRIHSCIRQIARDNQKKKQQMQKKQQKIITNHHQEQKKENVKQPQLQKPKINRASIIPSKSKPNQSFSLNVQDFQNKQEQLTALREQVRKQNFVNEENYILQKNFDHGRLLIHKNDFKKAKVVIYFDVSNPQYIIQSYIRMNQWNQQIQSARIINKLCTNVYILHMIFKKISWFSYQRQAVVIFAAFKVEQAYYIILKSIPAQQIIQINNPSVQFQQYIQLRYFSEKDDYLLMNILTTIDSKGYSNNQDHRKISIAFLKHLDHLRMFCMTQQSYIQNDRLFSFQKLKHSQIKDSNSFRSFSYEEYHEHKHHLIEREDEHFLSQYQQSNRFGQLLLKSLEKDPEINQQLLHFIKTFKTHEKYFLPHYFDQRTYFDPHRNQYVIKEKDNFIQQNGDWIISPHGDAIAMNESQVALQRNIVKYILKQIGSNIMSGKSIMNMSLPVQMFAGDSLLQRLINGFSYIPQYLPQAAKTKNPIEQMKLVTLFYIGMSNLYLKVLKPFNPIIGETFECSFGGISVYTEQICHHPPISAFYCKTQEFQFYGNFHSQLQMGFNKVYGTNLATHKLNFFKTNTHYQIKMMNLQIGGILYGQEIYRPSDKCFAYEKTNKIYMQFSAGKDKKKVYQSDKKLEPTNLIGGIFQVSNNFTKRFQKCEKKYEFDGVRPEQLVDICCQIRGLWLGDIYFNGVKVKSLFSPLPNRMQYRRFVLPSDSNLRPDIIYRRINRIAQSQQEKQILQDMQRKDQKLRIQRKQKKILID